MKKILLALPLFLLLSVPSHSKEKVYKTYTDIGELDPPSVTISQVLSSPDEFHREIFTDSSEDVRRQTKRASRVTEQVQLLREPVEYVFWLNDAQ